MFRQIAQFELDGFQLLSAVGLAALLLRYHLRRAFFRKKRSRSFVVRRCSRKTDGITVRQYRPSDFEACIGLYKINEPGRFPPNYLDAFAAYLQNTQSLILVAEQGGEVVGTGGINSESNDQVFYYWLTYGLIAPNCQGMGIGTVLLLARVALLLEPASAWPVFLQCVNQSRTFYERFGFRRIGADPSNEPLVAGVFMAMVNFKHVRQARTYLRKQGIDWQANQAAIPCKPQNSEEMKGKSAR